MVGSSGAAQWVFMTRFSISDEMAGVRACGGVEEWRSGGGRNEWSRDLLSNGYNCTVVELPGIGMVSSSGCVLVGGSLVRVNEPCRSGARDNKTTRRARSTVSFEGMQMQTQMQTQMHKQGGHVIHIHLLESVNVVNCTFSPI